MGRTAVLLRFSESDTAIRPQDLAGGLNDLVAATGLDVPATALGVLGRARLWDDDQGFQTSEKTVGQTQLRRDVTIEAVVQIPWMTTNGTYLFCQRGKGNSAAERILYGLQLVVTGAPGAPAVTLQMKWQKSSGAAATVNGVAFTPTAGWWYIAAARRWLSASSVEVEYFVNGRSIGVVTSADGDIEDGTGGTFYVGVVDPVGPSGMPPGTYLDELRVTSDARPAEEIRQIHRRHFVYPDLGYQAIRQLAPPGRAWSQDETSIVQRELRVDGAGLGHAWSLIEELYEDFLPDRAHRALARWQSLLGIAARPGETIAKQRLRVMSHLRRTHTYSRDGIQEALEEILAMVDAPIIERSNRMLDSFPGASLALWWFQEPGNGTVGTDGSGAAQLTLPNTATAIWDATTRNPVAIRTSVPDLAEIEVIAELTTTTNFTDPDDTTGLFVYDQISRAAHLFHWRNDAGSRALVSVLIDYVGGTVTTTAYSSGIPAAPLFLRYKRNANGTADLAWSTTGIEGPWTVVGAGVTTIAAPYWAGLSIRSPGATGALTAKFAQFQLWCPKARIVYEWYVYRNPATSPTGVADIAGAQLVIDKMKPAHTVGTVIESIALLCDDAFNLCDRDILEG